MPPHRSLLTGSSVNTTKLLGGGNGNTVKHTARSRRNGSYLLPLRGFPFASSFYLTFESQGMHVIKEKAAGAKISPLSTKRDGGGGPTS
jgi:hypothetical protein